MCAYAHTHTHIQCSAVYQLAKTTVFVFRLIKIKTVSLFCSVLQVQTKHVRVFLSHKLQADALQICTTSQLFLLQTNLSSVLTTTSLIPSDYNQIKLNFILGFTMESEPTRSKKNRLQ